MFCVACSGPAGPLCRSCKSTVRTAGERRLSGGLVVRSALVHEGAARRLVHHLKYRGINPAARLLAEPMVALLPEAAAALVPIPRVLTRLARYGIDPAGELAGEIARQSGLPVVHCLSRPIWWPRRAGPASAERGLPAFRCRCSAPPGAVLIDDVITTGTTLAAAREAVPGCRWAITATIAPSLGGLCRYHEDVAQSGPVEHGSVRVPETAADQIP